MEAEGPRLEEARGRVGSEAVGRQAFRRREEALGFETRRAGPGRWAATETPERRRVIAHVVLFRPKPELTDDQRRAFVTALEHALVNIPLIKRARVGRRLMVGRPYEQQNTHDFPFMAILEFEGEADLRAYLEHPAHQMLGAQFYVTSDAALVFDYELLEGLQVRNLLA